MKMPIQINRKLLHVIFPSNLNLEHPRCSMEVIDRKIEDPIINTNLKKKQLLLGGHFQCFCLYSINML